MTISVAQFRADLPEFADTAKFPNTMIQYWINFAVIFMTARWGASAVDPWPAIPIVPPAVAPVLTMYDVGMEQYVAHNVSLEAKDVKAASASGGIPGQASVGIVQSKSVDKVSVSYDNKVGTEQNAGTYALTIYGLRFIRMARLVGAGALQVNTGEVSNFTQSGAWPGPYIN